MKRLLAVVIFCLSLSAVAAAQETNVRVADGSDKNSGKTTDAKVTGDNSGTISAKLRGMNHFFTSVWDTGCNCVKVTGTVAVTGTFWQATQPVSGTFWQATQPVSGTFWQATQPVSVADGSNTTLGAKADAKSTATDTTAVTIMQVLKEISAMEQAPASRAVTNTGTFAVQSTIQTGSAQIGHLESNQSVNVAQVNGVTPLMGNGTTGTGSPRVTIASDNTANSNPWLAQPVPGTANGLSICYITSAASTNATNCKASAGLFYHLHAVNTTGVVYFLRLYNSSSGPTCSSATGFVETIPIPASTMGAGVVIDIAMGATYGTGIGFCLTGGGGSTDNTNAATGVYITIGYK
jgi:hypothetical protein